MIARGDIVWTDFGTPRGSEPAKIRPTIVVQDEWLLDSSIATVIVVPLTSNVLWEPFPGNVAIPAAESGLEKDSVALVAQVGPVSREFVDPYPVGRVPDRVMARVDAGLRLSLGL